jgi:hypothetical protein
VDQVEQAAVVPQQGPEEFRGLVDHRVAERRRELGELLRVGLDGRLETGQVQPLAGEVAREGPGLGVRDEAQGRGLDLVGRLELLVRG